MIVWHEDVSADPSINMRVIRVMFDESKYNYQTNINGTRQEIGNYFRGASLNVGNYPKEIMRTPVRIEFLAEDEDTIAMDIRV